MVCAENWRQDHARQEQAAGAAISVARKLGAQPEMSTPMHIGTPDLYSHVPSILFVSSEHLSAYWSL